MGGSFVIPKKDNTGVVETQKLTDLVELLIFNLPRGGAAPLSMEDAIKGTKVYEQLQSIKNTTLELEDAEYTWLIAKVDAHAAMMFGIDASQVKKALELLVDDLKVKE